MSTATADPTLESLVPRGSWPRSAGLVLLALVLLGAAWFAPPLLQPGVLGTSGGGSSMTVGPGIRVISTETLQPHGPGDVRITGVDSVPGAHVVDAWVLDGEHSVPPFETSPTAADALAAIGVGPQTHQPRAVPSGRTATLVVLWQVDDCAALTDKGPMVRVATLVGTTRSEQLRWNAVLTQATSAGTARCPT